MSAEIISGLTIVLVTGTCAQILAWRLKIPSILLLLLFGFLVGPIGGLINPDRLLGPLLFPLVSVSVAIILFEGGLSLSIPELGKLRGSVFRIITLGALVTWVVAALGAQNILGFDIGLSWLLGAILTVTGPTVIIPLLRQIRPSLNSSSVLKWEGILIDPVGALLAVIVFEAIISQDLMSNPALVVLSVFKALVAGGLVGILGALIIIFVLRNYLVPDQLHNPFTLMMVILSFSSSNAIYHESGLVAVTLMGIFLANQKSIAVKHIVEFKESLGVLLIGFLFVVLAAKVDYNYLEAFSWRGLCFLALMIFVARPLSVFVSCMNSQLKFKEKLFISLVAPRGIVAAAVSSIFTYELIAKGYTDASVLVSTTFFMIVATVVFYGVSAPILARWLGIAQQDSQGLILVGAHRFSRELARTLLSEGIEAILVDTNPHAVHGARLDGIPALHGSILADSIEQEIEALGGIGKLLAVTPNDEANSLAALDFMDIFGKANVFQLALESSDNGQMDGGGGSSQHLRGRYLFAKNITYSTLAQQMARGAVLKKTKFTEEFTWKNFQEMYASEAVPLIVITADSKVQIVSEDIKLDPKPGQTLISLVSADKA